MSDRTSPTPTRISTENVSTMPLPTVPRSVRNRSEDYVRATLNLLDRDNDGRLSAAEAHGFMDMHGVAGPMLVSALQEIGTRNTPFGRLPVSVATNIVTDNPVIFDANVLAQRYTDNPQYPGLDATRVARIIREVLPRGVETIRLSDECAEVGQLSCTPLPNNLLLVGARSRDD